MDKAEREGYKYVDSRLAKLIMRIRLRDISITDEIHQLPPQMFKSIQDYYTEVDYWIVYYSMKDFQPEDFSIKDVRKMRYVHDLAIKILNMSSSDSRKLVEVIKSPEGKKLLKLTLDFNVPIVDEAWKATPLQYQFLEIGENGVRKELTHEEFESMIHGSELPEAIKKLVRR